MTIDKLRKNLCRRLVKLGYTPLVEMVPTYFKDMYNDKNSRYFTYYKVRVMKNNHHVRTITVGYKPCLV